MSLSCCEEIVLHFQFFTAPDIIETEFVSHTNRNAHVLGRDKCFPSITVCPGVSAPRPFSSVVWVYLCISSALLMFESTEQLCWVSCARKQEIWRSSFISWYRQYEYLQMQRRVFLWFRRFKDVRIFVRTDDHSCTSFSRMKWWYGGSRAWFSAKWQKIDYREMAEEVGISYDQCLAIKPKILELGMPQPTVFYDCLHISRKKSACPWLLTSRMCTNWRRRLKDIVTGLELCT